MYRKLERLTVTFYFVGLCSARTPAIYSVPLGGGGRGEKGEGMEGVGRERNGEGGGGGGARGEGERSPIHIVLCKYGIIIYCILLLYALAFEGWACLNTFPFEGLVVRSWL